MKIKDLISHQFTWESERGINNPNHNLDRVQDELIEAFEESDPDKRLTEMLDVLIILSGGIAKLANELGMSYEVVESRLIGKLSMNEDKYPVESMWGIATDWAVYRCRHYWTHDLTDWGEGEYY